MREKLAEIAAYEQEGLENIIATHAERAEWAAGELAKIENPYSWLRAEEWPQAAAMSQFIAAEVAGLPDAKAIAAYVDAAAGAGRVQTWLARWHGQKQLGELSSDFFRPQAKMALEAAADKLLPPSELAMKQKATEDLQDARRQIQAAERVLDAPDTAARLGVPGYVSVVRQEEGFAE